MAKENGTVPCEQFLGPSSCLEDHIVDRLLGDDQRSIAGLPGYARCNKLQDVHSPCAW